MRRGKRHEPWFEEAQRGVLWVLSIRSKSFLPVIKNLLLDKRLESSFRKKIIQKVERSRKKILIAQSTRLSQSNLNFSFPLFKLKSN